MLPLLIALHVVAAALWIGGVFFAFMVLRAAAPPEPALRLATLARAFTRFFPWVWVFIGTLVFTGYAMLAEGVPKPWPVRAMEGVGWLMFALFAVLSLRLLPQFRRALAAGDLPAAAVAVARMRMLIGTNLLLGIVLIGLGAAARHLA